MDFEALYRRLGELEYRPLTTRDEAARLYEFVLDSGVEDVLELGFAHGTSTCALAAALDERGRGRVTTIDRESARERRPNIHELLARTGLGGYVAPVFAASSYNWELMKLIQARSEGGTTAPCFDFCFIDGAHSWETDGLAFFLVDKLLRPGGWILFDDLHWSYATSPALRDTERVRAMPEDERGTPQIMRVVTLLAHQHPSYSRLRIRGNVAWIAKTTHHDDPPPGDEVVERLTRRADSLAIPR